MPRSVVRQLRVTYFVSVIAAAFVLALLGARVAHPENSQPAQIELSKEIAV